MLIRYKHLLSRQEYLRILWLFSLYRPKLDSSSIVQWGQRGSYQIYRQRDNQRWNDNLIFQIHICCCILANYWKQRPYIDLDSKLKHPTNWNSFSKLHSRTKINVFSNFRAIFFYRKQSYWKSKVTAFCNLAFLRLFERVLRYFW